MLKRLTCSLSQFPRSLASEATAGCRAAEPEQHGFTNLSIGEVYHGFFVGVKEATYFIVCYPLRNYEVDDAI